MDVETGIFAATAIGIVAFGLWHSWHTTRRQERRDRAVLTDAHARGLHVPVSLHPVIDPDICMGSAACVAACPEQDVLGLISQRGTLVAAANCVGHGRCAAACPVHAIKLVFGTATRGVELPDVSGTFESSVPGLYIAGELGGMGLIANAFEQAIQAMDAIAASLDGDPAPDDAEVVDVVVIGAGPAGLAGSLRAKELGLSYTCVEQGAWGGAVRSYPRAKIVMTRAVRVPLYGPVKLRETSKEALLELWDRILADTGVEIQTNTRVLGAERQGGVFHVDTTRGVVKGRRVLLSIGRRGTPRRLGVPGDTNTNVTTVLIEPEQWRGCRTAVVGGGDVAVEAALALAEQPDTDVTLIYRGESLYRPKPALRDKIERAADAGQVRLVLGAEVVQVTDDAIEVSTAAGGPESIEVDQVFACLGAEAPTPFLNQLGVATVTKFGEA